MSEFTDRDDLAQALNYIRQERHMKVAELKFLETIERHLHEAVNAAYRPKKTKPDD